MKIDSNKYHIKIPKLAPHAGVSIGHLNYLFPSALPTFPSIYRHPPFHGHFPLPFPIHNHFVLLLILINPDYLSTFLVCLSSSSSSPSVTIFLLSLFPSVSSANLIPAHHPNQTADGLLNINCLCCNTS